MKVKLYIQSKLVSTVYIIASVLMSEAFQLPLYETLL